MTFRVSLLIDAIDKGAEARLKALSAASKGAGADLNVLNVKGSEAGAKVSTSLGKVAKASQTAITAMRPMDELLDGLGKSAVQAAAETQRYQAELDGLRARFNPLFAASKRYEMALEEIAAAERLGAISAKEAAAARDRAAQAMAPARQGIAGLGATADVSAMHVGNMTAQFNDLIVGVQMGQSPIQMAIQQGLQITQVFGQTGGAGAVKVLGAAFKSLMSPMNLITIGAIAAGAALANWLTSAPEEALTFEERMDALAEAVGDYSDAVDLATGKTEDLEERFGAAGAKAAHLGKGLSAFARVDAIDALDAAVAGLVETFGPLEGQFFRGNYAFEELDRTASRLRRSFDVTQQEAKTIAVALRDIGRAEGLEAKVSEAADLNDVLIDIFGSAEQVPGVLREVALQAGEVAKAAGEIAAADGAAFREHIELLKEKLDLMVKDKATAEETLLTLQEQNAVASATLAYGADSAEVAELRAAAERRAFDEMLASLDVSEGLKDELRAAFEQALQLAGVDASSNLWEAASAAAAITGNLVDAFNAKARLAALGAEPPVGGRGGAVSEWQQRRRDAGLGIDPGGEFRQDWHPDMPKLSGRGRGGGGGRGTREQTSALEKLIERQKQELELLRATDPVQKELIRNREALSGATVEERAAVEQLIEQRLAEQEALEEAQERYETFRDIGYEAFDGLIRGGQSFADVLDNLADKLAALVLQALLLGEGPLGGLFGLSDQGGILGIAASAFGLEMPTKKARGGRIFGPGTGTSDSVPAMLSDGEYVVNAQATSRNLPLLESINSGASLPRFATGGMVGGGAGGGFGDINISMINTSRQPLEARVEEERAPNGQRAFRLILAEQVGGALKETGGGARKVLLNSYGVRPRGTVR